MFIIIFFIYLKKKKRKFIWIPFPAFIKRKKIRKLKYRKAVRQKREKGRKAFIFIVSSKEVKLFHVFGKRIEKFHLYIIRL